MTEVVFPVIQYILKVLECVQDASYKRAGICLHNVRELSFSVHTHVRVECACVRTHNIAIA